MFAPLGLFRDIPCPQGQKCDLLTCIFSHDSPPSTVHTSQNAQEVHDGEKAVAHSSPPAPKRVKLEASGRGQTPEKANGSESLTASSNDIVNVRPSKPENRITQKSRQQSGMGAMKPPLTTTSRSVSPPPPRRSSETKAATRPTKNQQEQPSGDMLRRNAPKEPLNPRMIPKAPAPHATRSTILTKLHQAMQAQNKTAASDKDVERRLILSPNELVTMALDEEEKAAKGSANIYSNVIKLRIVRFTKMSKQDWIEEVKAHLNSRYYKEESKPRSQPQKGQPLITELSVSEELALVGKLVTPLNGLEEFGYVTRAPTEQEIETARKGLAEARGWEKCDRCAGRFQVFPGRREDGTLTSGGPCTYHPGKAVSPPKKPTDHITGPSDDFYLCCNEPLGASTGCTKVSTHVFKVSETKRLASVLQFQKTPIQPDDAERRPVSFDCEMGYTTLGLEMIRLTAVSWPEGKELLDILVKPMGEVLDLNSAYSGIFPEHYINAIPYGSGHNSSNAASSTPGVNSDPVISTPEQRPAAHSEDPSHCQQVLQVVESPAEARKLLFQLLQPDTPLIGHSIDNDLNACRIIHPTVIDTVILYPHPSGGLPIRSGLKILSQKFLNRDIQTGGAQGHDSKEDAIATGDLVRAKAARSWKILKVKGWLIRDGNLVPPPGTGKEEGRMLLMRSLKPGAGKKRKENRSSPTK